MSSITIDRGFIKWSQNTEPTTNVNPFDIWFDTNNYLWKIRDKTNSYWNVFNVYKTGNGSIGVFGGGSSLTNTIDYITISTTGDATDFGDLTVAKSRLSATSNGTDDRGVFGGEYTGSSYSNTIEYITISSINDASDFGDLTVARYGLAATSND
jgi:hypothetical protein